MKKLSLKEKTGFTSILPFVIYETNGTVFYSSDFTDRIEKGLPVFFNMPQGDFLYKGIIRKLEKPVPIFDIELPKKERNYETKKYKIVFEKNANKCTIFYERGLIVFDTAFKNAPLYIKMYIYFHELGHHYYKTEEFADLYSVKKLLEKGFNPSQIGRAELISLSNPESVKRKEFIINKLTKNNS